MNEIVINQVRFQYCVSGDDTVIFYLSKTDTKLNNYFFFLICKCIDESSL